MRLLSLIALCGLFLRSQRRRSRAGSILLKRALRAAALPGVGPKRAEAISGFGRRGRFVGQFGCAVCAGLTSHPAQMLPMCA